MRRPVGKTTLEQFRAQSQPRSYVPAVANWLEVFPRDQLLAVPFDRIVGDPRNLVRDVLIHIGVDPNRYPWDRLSEDKVGSGPVAEMPEDVRAYLRRCFVGERTLWPRSFSAILCGKNRPKTTSSLTRSPKSVSPSRSNLFRTAA